MKPLIILLLLFTTYKTFVWVNNPNSTPSYIFNHHPTDEEYFHGKINKIYYNPDSSGTFIVNNIPFTFDSSFHPTLYGNILYYPGNLKFADKIITL